ncbi:hemagglutinin protein [Pseudofulvibacter geojedonensis]|uniref:Hemagglutinin protein n=1 Tax=Pseudofulvibacter geojedonensis TaxID=1123758 RepID=A0ABW3HZZ2_9FLAO
MKKGLIVLLLTSFLGFSQSLERQVIGGAGATLTDNSTVILDYTVGEVVVSSITDGNTLLTQGFQQGEVLLSVNIGITAFLQGALLSPNSGEESLMRDDLRVANYIPTTSPYSDGLTCNPNVFTVTGANAIVDWVFVELRDKNDNTSVLHGKSALLQRDGDIVGVDGVSPLNFITSANNYFVAIKHRNHLGIMSSNAIALSDTVTILNFTEANNQITYGNNAQTTHGIPNGIIAMWSGNANSDNTVKYLGSGNDTNSIKDKVLSETGNTTNSNLYTSQGYHTADVNLDGAVKYQGSGNDANTVKDAVLAHPTNQVSPSNLFTITEQLPEN